MATLTLSVFSAPLSKCCVERYERRISMEA